LNGLVIPAGSTYGFYVTSTDNPISYTTLDTTINDGHITYTTGTGNVYPFGVTYAPRTWNGTMYYTVGSSCSSGRKQVIVTVEDCSGVAENTNEQNLSIWPNPSDGIINFALTNYNGEVEVNVMTLQGQTVLSSVFDAGVSSNYSIDLSSLPKGVYLLKTTGEDLSVLKQIIIH
jgi:hypothetical protein